MWKILRHLVDQATSAATSATNHNNLTNSTTEYTTETRDDHQTITLGQRYKNSNSHITTGIEIVTAGAKTEIKQMSHN